MSDNEFMEEQRDDALFVPHLEELPGLEEEVRRGARVAEYGDILESICGITDDSQPVEQYDGTLGVTVGFVDTHESAVAQVQWNSNLASIYDNPGNVAGVRWGSGTMITADLFLTCGHLFDQTGGGWSRPRVNGTTNIISPQEIATNMHLNFNYQVDQDGNQQASQSYAITELVEYRLDGVDMAICRVAGNPGSIHGTTQVSTTDASVGDMLAIIGHPAGLPKRIEAGPATGLTPSQLRYDDIDTLGGNSGSGILSAATGRIVGVHTNGGCNTAGFNYGVPIETFRAASPTLQGLGSIATLVSADTSPALDQIVTHPIADQVATLVSTDLTSVVLDTNPWADQIRTHPAIDDIRTSPARDVIGTSPIGDVGPTLVEDIWRDPAGLLVNPAVRRAAGAGSGLRPFVLANPHHAPTLPVGSEAGVAGGGQADQVDQREQYEAALAQYEQAMAVQREALEQLEAAYTDLYAEYADAYGDG